MIRALLLYAFLSTLSLPSFAEITQKFEADDGSRHAPVELPEVGVLLDMEFERIIDGDTFEASGRKIRLWGIDAPEKDELGYWVSTTLLEGILNGSAGDLACKLVNVDRYKSDVMHCFIDGLDIGSMMVQVGMAKDYKKYSGGYYQYEEQKARDKEIGIWKVSVED